MQFSENWLRTFVNPDLNTAELSELLTMAGLEVEETKSVAPFTKIVVAEVLEVEKHPKADRLSVCKVDAGTGEILSIVCGAPNVRAGMKTGCALIGAELPTPDGKSFQIKKTKLRDVESHGMLCSFRELALSEDHSGIMDLEASATKGQDLREYLGMDDTVFDIKLTPDEADCLSVLGVAREVSALTGAPLTMPEIKEIPATIADKQKVNIIDADLCGRFTSRIIRNINAAAETPKWMKERIERGGQRSISALVDISNYVMLELGSPNHIYDLAKVKGDIDVRWGKEGEKAALLNDTTVDVDGEVGVIADANGVESLAGIMGGSRTSCSDDTKDVLLEAAFWWPDSIRGRTRRYNFTTEAAHRFERGVDFEGTNRAIARLTQLIVEICGTDKTACGPVDDQVVNLPERKTVSVRASRASKVIGVDISADMIEETFKRLELPFTREGETFHVTAPSWRFDIEIEEDLIEEIARIYGYDNIPALPPVAANVMRIHPENTRSLFSLRYRMADLDYHEVVNYSFVSEETEKDFSANDNPIRLVNPIAEQMSVMRSSMIGPLVANLAYNANRKVTRMRVFEIGAVFLRDERMKDSPLTVAGYRQPKRLGAAVCGPVVDVQWGVETRNADFFDIKGDLEALFAPTPVTFKKKVHPALHPGRSAAVIVNGREVGIIGELHPVLQEKYSLPANAAVFEVDCDALTRGSLPKYTPVSRFQNVVRDLAFVVDASLPVQNIVDIFKREKDNNPLCGIMQSLVLFDDYRGQGLEAGMKSLAFTVTLSDETKTLEDAAVDAAVEAFVKAVEAGANAKLRG